MPACVLYLCLALVFIVAPALWAEPVTLSTSDGRTMGGEIAEWTTEQIVVASEGGIHSVAPKDLLAIHFAKESETKSDIQSARWIELSDGSRLPFTEFSVSGRTATIVSPLTTSTVKLPAGQIRSVQFSLVGKTAIAESLPDQTGDTLVIAKKDSTETETLVGVIGDVTPEHVEFTWEGDTISVKLSKIAAIGFHRSEGSQQPEPLCVLSLALGASFVVSEISLQDQDLDVKTVGGLKLKLAFADVVKADYTAGKLTYLSDMEPLKSTWTPLIALPPAATTIKDFGTLRRDISFTGSPLTLSRQDENSSDSSLETYNKGLALRSRTELEYRIPKNMRRFVATAGIDPETQEQGNVLLRIEVDGQTLLEQSVDGREQPVDIDVDVSGRQRLKVFVDYGENLDTGDRLHLVEARLIK